MMTRITLQQQLEMTDRYIAEAEARMARQAALIARLAAKGQATDLAETLMATMERSLQFALNHRELILQEIVEIL